MSNKKKVALIVFLLFAVIIIGVLGYMKLMNISFIDALYMTVITISTVGFEEVGTMNTVSKIFTIVIIFSGLSIFGYAITSLVALFFEGELKDAWRKKRMDAKILNLKNHYIICGAGDVGRTVIKSFIDSGLSFVVIEEKEKSVDELKQQGILTILGDATHEDTLKKAGIERATGLLSCLDNDAENVYTVLTARQLNPDIYIVSRAVELAAHSKLSKAGANKTISPNEIGGQRLAALFIRPSVVSFLDVITRAGDVTLDLDEVIVPKHSSLNKKKSFRS